MNHGSGTSSDDDHDISGNNRSVHSDFYDLLNVDERSATSADIQRSYKALSRTFHPDKLSRLSSASVFEDEKFDEEDISAQAQEIFVRIKLAHDVLTDRILRLAYDYDGFSAVSLVMRSQQHWQQKRDKRTKSSASKNHEEDDEDVASNDSDNDEDDEYGNSPDSLYNALQKADSESDALKILEEALEEYRAQQEASMKSHKQTWDAGMDSPYYLGILEEQQGQQVGLDPDASSFSFNCRNHPIRERAGNSNMTMSMGVTNQIRRTATVDSSAQVGLDYQPTRGTHVSMDVMTQLTQLMTTMPSKKKKVAKEKQNQSPFSLSLRSSRQLLNGTSLIVSAGGNLASINSWTYSLATYRTLIFRKERRWQQETKFPKSSPPENTKWHASWRMGIRPVLFATASPSSEPLAETQQSLQQQRLQQPVERQYRKILTPPSIVFLVGTLKSLCFPQYSIRLNLLSASPLKISYQTAERNSFYGSYQWTYGFLHRTKILYIWDLAPHCNIRYGLKYETKPEAGLLGYLQQQAGTIVSPIQSGVSPWTILLQFQVHEWTIRLPLHLLQGGGVDIHTGKLVSRLGTLLLFQRFQENITNGWKQLLYKMTGISKPKESKRQFWTQWWIAEGSDDNSDKDSMLSTVLLSSFSGVVANVASKKRQRDGLIILRATWQCQKASSMASQHYSGHGDGADESDVDVTDLLQFWTVDNRLSVPLHQTKPVNFRSSVPRRQQLQQQRTKNWLNLLWSWLQPQRCLEENLPPGAAVSRHSLVVRYQFQGRVYDYRFQDNEKNDLVLELPQPSAIELGLVGRVL